MCIRDRYNDLRTSVLRFANGFDLADTSRASVLALREEWMEEEHEQYRLTGGFDQLTNFLEKECLRSGCIINTSSAVTEIKWQKNHVEVVTSNKTYDTCLLYTSDAADERSSVDLGGRRIIK